MSTRRSRRSSTSKTAASVAGVLLGVSTMVVGGAFVFAAQPWKDPAAAEPVVSAFPTAGASGSSPSATSSPPDDESPLSEVLPTAVTLPGGATGDVDGTYAGVGGEMVLPTSGQQLVWWPFGAAPGEKSGTVLIAGHKDTKEEIGLFNQLFGLNVGDRVIVSTAGGKKMPYVVESKRPYLKSALPDALFGRTGKPRLALLTCGGPYDHQKHAYRDNYVVYAVPA